MHLHSVTIKNQTKSKVLNSFSLVLQFFRSSSFLRIVLLFNRYLRDFVIPLLNISLNSFFPYSEYIPSHCEVLCNLALALWTHPMQHFHWLKPSLYLFLENMNYSLPQCHTNCCSHHLRCPPQNYSFNRFFSNYSGLSSTISSCGSQLPCNRIKLRGNA